MKEAQAPEVMSGDMMQKAVCVVVSLGSIGNSRKVSASQVTVDADRDLIKVSKVLLECDELDSIKQLDGEIRRFIYSRCLPNSYLKGGTYLLPLSLVTEVDERMNGFLVKRSQLVDAFINVYDASVAQAKERLKGLFDPGNYPSSNVVRTAFTLDWQYIQFGVALQLDGINAEIMQRERDKAAKKWEEAADEVRAALRCSMADLVEHLVGRLSGSDEDGKPKVFRNSLIDNVREFLGTFDARNIVNDTQLDELVKKAKGLVEGIDPDTLRKNENVRAMVANGFAQIKEKLDTMLVDRPKRSIELT